MTEELLPDLIDKFIDDIRVTRTEATIVGYKIDLLQFGTFLNDYRGKGIEEAADIDITAFIKWLATEGRSMKTLHRKFSSIKTFYSWVKSNTNVPILVTDDIKIPTVYETLPDVLELEQVKKMVKVSGNSRDKALIMFLYDTALRVGEVKEITVDMLDWGNSAVLYTRVIFLGDSTKKALLTYLEERTEISSYLFLSRYGKALSERRILTTIQETAKRAGVENYNNLSANVLRHTKAVQILEHEAMTLEELANYLGTDVKSVSVYKELAHKKQWDKIRKATQKLSL